MPLGIIGIAINWKKLYLDEFNKYRHNKYFIIANIISLSRVVFAPIVAYFILTGKYSFATIFYALGYLTDAIDGYVARKYEVTSQLGKKLDPIGSSIMMNTAVICLIIKHQDVRIPIIMIWIIAGIITQTSGLLCYLSKPRYKPIFKASGLFAGAVVLDFGTLCFLSYYFLGRTAVMIALLLTMVILVIFGKHKKYYQELVKALPIVLSR